MTGLPGQPGEIPERRLLGRDANLVERIRVFRRGESLEVDTSSFYRIVRHRVLFEEVELATIHRGRSYRLVFLFALLGVLTSIGGAIATEASGGAVASWFFLCTLGGAAAGFLLPDWVVSIQSRRTWTRMRFAFFHGRARRVFDELVAAVRETQRRLAAERPPSPVHRSPFAPPKAEDFPAPEGDETGAERLPPPGDPLV